MVAQETLGAAAGRPAHRSALPEERGPAKRGDHQLVYQAAPRLQVPGLHRLALQAAAGRSPVLPVDAGVRMGDPELQDRRRSAGSNVRS
jgi:hypothetical protein